MKKKILPLIHSCAVFPFSMHSISFKSALSLCSASADFCRKAGRAAIERISKIKSKLFKHLIFALSAK